MRERKRERERGWNDVMAKWSRHSLHSLPPPTCELYGPAAAPMKWTSFACLPPSKVCSTAKPLTLPSPPPPPSSAPVMVVEASHFICLVKCFLLLLLCRSATVLFSVSISIDDKSSRREVEVELIISWLVIVLCWCRLFLTCGSPVLFLLLLWLLLLFTSSFPLLHLFCHYPRFLLVLEG